MVGLQPPVLQQTLTFPVYRGEFVQLLNIHDTHWCVVTNVGCEEGVVNVMTARVTQFLMSPAAPLLALCFPQPPN